MLYVSIGILGATVMPHNLYLHSSIVQTRKFEQTPEGRREAIKFATIDSSAALMFALFINAAILILRRPLSIGPASGCSRDSRCVQVAQPVTGCWRSEHTVCRRVARVRAKLDSYRHACRPDSDGRFSQHPNYAVVASADHATIAIVPAIVVIGLFGEGKTTELLIASQVCLSMQLGFAVWPLMRFTAKKAKMGDVRQPHIG
jgi:Mn2+ and Fe2+ transporters of the NRAMP family